MIRAGFVNAALVGAALLVSSLAAEAAYRWLTDVPLLATDDWRRARAIPALAGYDPELGWSHAANNRLRVRTSAGTDTTISTIADGIRKNRADRDEHPDPGSVLVVGDSFAEGFEVDDHETWPAALERLSGIRILNAAVGGYGVDQIVLRAEQLVPRLAPRAVVVGMLDQDIPRTSYTAFGRAKPYFTVEGDGLMAHQIPVPAPVDRPDPASALLYGALGRSAMADAALSRLAPLWWIGGPAQQFTTVGTDGPDVSCRLLARLKTVLDQRAVPALLVMQYGWAAASLTARPSHATPVLRCAERLGYHVVDEYDTMRALAIRDLDGFRGYFVHSPDFRVMGHMSAVGNRAVAELVRPALERALADDRASSLEIRR